MCIRDRGISEATVSLEGNNRLRVEMPGVEDAQEAIDQIGRTAQMQFLLADGTVVLTGNEVKNAAIDTDSQNGGYKINLEFTAEGSDKFAQATKKAASQQVTVSKAFQKANVQKNAVIIMLDDEIVTAPTVDQTINSTTCETVSYTHLDVYKRQDKDNGSYDDGCNYSLCQHSARRRF